MSAPVPVPPQPDPVVTAIASTVPVAAALSGAGVAAALAAVSAGEAARHAEAGPLLLHLVEELGRTMGQRLTVHQAESLAGTLAAAIDARIAAHAGPRR